MTEVLRSWAITRTQTLEAEEEVRATEAWPRTKGAELRKGAGLLVLCRV